MMNFFITISCFAARLPRMGRGGRTGRKTEFEFLLDLKKSIEMPVYGDRDYVGMGLGRAVTSKSDRNSIKLSAGSIERVSEACDNSSDVVQSRPALYNPTRSRPCFRLLTQSTRFYLLLLSLALLLHLFSSFPQIPALE